MTDIDQSVGTEPPDLIAAVTWTDPYPAYRRLLAAGPVTFDPTSGNWVVSGYREIASALTDPALWTRPEGEPVPAPLVGHPTGDVFGRLVRMTDHPRSRETRRALELAVAAVPDTEVTRIADHVASHVLAAEERAGGQDWPTRVLHRIPVTVVGTLLGLTGTALDLTDQVLAFARAIAPPPFAGPVAAGDRAVLELTGRIAPLLDAAAPDAPGLLGTFARHPAMRGPDGRDLVIANAIGLLFQSLDATAGLIGNSLRALAQRPDLRATVRADPERLDAVLRETLRHDPPVQNTRRFVVTETAVGGQRLAPGDRLLLVLAAANRDPAVFPDPDRFDPDRAGPEPLTFGIGPHRCPGQRLAWVIARAGVHHAVRCGLADDRYWTETPAWLPSGNARIPIIVAPEPATRETRRQPDSPSNPVRSDQ